MAHTPGPWHVCRGGACSCFTVMSDHHPVAEITHGAWGDSWPAIRVVPGNLGATAEAYLERSDYGTVSDDEARANWHLIASATEMYGLLKSVRGHAPDHDAPPTLSAGQWQTLHEVLERAEGRVTTRITPPQNFSLPGETGDE